MVKRLSGLAGLLGGIAIAVSAGCSVIWPVNRINNSVRAVENTVQDSVVAMSDPIGSNNPDRPCYSDQPRLEKKKEKPGLEGSFSTSFVSNYVGNGGFVLGKGPGIQNNLVVSRTNNFREGDSVYGGAWMHYDFGDHELIETDFIGGVNFPVYFFEKLQGGYSKPDFGDKVTLEFQHWNYPGEILGSRQNHDNVLKGEFHHHSRGDLKFGWIHIFQDMDARGDLLYFKASKDFPIKKSIDVDFGYVLTPYARISYAHGFYGLHGITDTTIGAKLNVGLEKETSLEFDLGYQIGLLDSVRDTPYFNASLIRSF